MPFEMNPRTKKIIEALGCDMSTSSDVAHNIMMEYLTEADHVLEKVLKGGGSPNIMLLHAAKRLPRKIVEIRAESIRNIESGEGTAGVDGTALARIIALMAVSATSALKDISFVMSRGVGCSKCSKRDKCKGNDCNDDGLVDS